MDILELKKEEKGKRNINTHTLNNNNDDDDVVMIGIIVCIKITLICCREPPLPQDRDTVI